MYDRTTISPSAKRHLDSDPILHDYWVDARTCIHLIGYSRTDTSDRAILYVEKSQFLAMDVTAFLAHLNRRLMGELIVYQSLRRPSVRHPSVRQHFQKSSPLKPLGQLNSNFIWRLLRTRERKFVQMVLVK